MGETGQILKRLMNRGCGFDLPSSNCSTLRAARTGDIELLTKALDSGEDIDVRRAQMSALHWAVIYGQVDAALMLIERGADVNAGCPLRSCAASNSISDTDALRVAEALVASGAAGDEETLELAEIRGKAKLAAFLAAHTD
jgi:ankyrin repeat protein